MICTDLCYQMSDRELGFLENFALSGAAAVISKTAAAPIERVKLLLQNQDEMLKSGRLAEPYKGVVDCSARIFKTEGRNAMWCCVVVHFLINAHHFAVCVGAMFRVACYSETILVVPQTKQATWFRLVYLATPSTSK